MEILQNTNSINIITHLLLQNNAFAELLIKIRILYMQEMKMKHLPIGKYEAVA